MKKTLAEEILGLSREFKEDLNFKDTLRIITNKIRAGKTPTESEFGSLLSKTSLGDKVRYEGPAFVHEDGFNMDFRVGKGEDGYIETIFVNFDRPNNSWEVETEVGGNFKSSPEVDKLADQIRKYLEKGFKDVAPKGESALDFMIASEKVRTSIQDLIGLLPEFEDLDTRNHCERVLSNAVEGVKEVQNLVEGYSVE